jgi:hypothetical protein
MKYYQNDEIIKVADIRKSFGVESVSDKAKRMAKDLSDSCEGCEIYFDEDGNYLRTADPGCWYDTSDQAYVIKAGKYQSWEVEAIIRYYVGGFRSIGRVLWLQSIERYPA